MPPWTASPRWVSPASLAGASCFQPCRCWSFREIITLLAQRCEPFLTGHHALDAVTGVAGLLVFCVSLLVLELKKLEVADYLPSLAMAPLLAWLWS